MMVMKRIVYFIFAFFFALNTVSLAYAAPCMHKAVSMEMENCHEMDMQDKEEKQDSKQSHCEGICLCQSVALSAHILPFDEQASVIFNAIDTVRSYTNEDASYNITSPPYRPPILFS